MQQNSSLESTHWQASLNPALLQRLLRSMQPGMMRPQFAQQVIARTQRLSDRLPLLAQFAQRQGGIASLQVDQPPIVYAQPLSEAESQLASKTSTASQQPSPPKTESGSPTVIQAKFADSSPASVLPKSPTVVQAKLSQSTAIAPAGLTADSVSLTSELLSASEALPLPSSAIAPTASASPIVSVNPLDPQPSPINSPKVVQETTSIPTFDPLSTLAVTQPSPFEPSVSEPAISEPISTTVILSSPKTELHPITPRSIVQAQQIAPAGFQTEQPAKLIQPLQSSTAIPTQSFLSDAVDSLAASTVNPRSLQSPSAPDASRPIVQVSRGLQQSLPLGSQAAQQRIPLVFTNPLVLAAQTYLEQETQKRQQGNPGSSVAMNSQSTGARSLVPQTSKGPNAPLPNAQPILADKTQPTVDMEAITKQVEQRLMQRLVIESERRGRTKWH